MNGQSGFFFGLKNYMNFFLQKNESFFFFNAEMRNNYFITHRLSSTIDGVNLINRNDKRKIYSKIY